MQTSPLLNEAAQAAGLPVVALNADKVLELDVSDAERTAYTKKLLAFTHAAATPALIDAYGGVSVFPTLFFVNRSGTVVRQMVNRQDRASLDAAIRAAKD
jgi:thiol-disulfide isomerase/thioredoxin